MRMIGNAALGLVALLAATSSHRTAVAGPLRYTFKKFIQARGLDPAIKIEKNLGLKTLSCEFQGRKKSVKDDGLAICLLAGFREFDKHGAVPPIKVVFESVVSKRRIDANLTWKPHDFRQGRDTWKRKLPTHYLVYRTREVRDFVKNYLAHDLVIDTSPAIGIDDFKIGKKEDADRRWTFAFKGLLADRIVSHTYADEDERTLSGHLELWSRDANQKILVVDYSTNWKAFEKAPLKGHVQGELIETTAELGPESDDEVAEMGVEEREGEIQ